MDKKIGFIGCGNMGKAILGGLIASGQVQPGQIWVYTPSPDKVAALRDQYGINAADSAQEVAQIADIVFGAVKPGIMTKVLGDIASSLNKESLVVSIAAGVTLEQLARALGHDRKIIRAMPNTPLMLGVGATQLVKNAAASEGQLAAVRSLFDKMGVTTVFDKEDMINEAIPYAGSAPAYIYAYADAMVQSAKKHGIDEQDALQMFCQTMIGAAKMLMQGEKTPAELIRAVCSPGGTTLAGMQVLEERDLYGMVAEACDKCTARAYELGK